MAFWLAKINIYCIMKLEERKRIIEDALTNSFVDDYRAYKNTMDIVNKDLKKSNIEYQYSYDEFCLDFLSESLLNIQDIDIFTADSFEAFYGNFWKFNLYNLQCMLNRKLEALGYNFNEFFKNSKMKDDILPSSRN